MTKPSCCLALPLLRQANKRAILGALHAQLLLDASEVQRAVAVRVQLIRGRLVRLDLSHGGGWLQLHLGRKLAGFNHQNQKGSSDLFAKVVTYCQKDLPVVRKVGETICS